MPHPDWTPFFREVVLKRVVLERETSLELAKDATWRGKRILEQAA